MFSHNARIIASTAMGEARSLIRWFFSSKWRMPQLWLQDMQTLRRRLRWLPLPGATKKGKPMKSKYMIAFLVLMGLPGCQSILKSEPAKGTLPQGHKVLVDDGTCPAGQVKQVTGATPGTPRVKECIPMPAR